MNNASDEHELLNNDETEFIELIEYETVDDIEQLEYSFPLAETQNDDKDEEDAVDEENEHVHKFLSLDLLEQHSPALSLIETADTMDNSAAAGYVEEADHLLAYHSSGSAAETVSLLMPELNNATALDCGNFVDYDEFNLCLNNILSEEDDDEGDGVGTHKETAEPHRQRWHEAGDVLNIVQLNNDLGLSFQEFANEAATLTTANEERSANSSSPQLA